MNAAVYIVIAALVTSCSLSNVLLFHHLLA